MLPFTIVEFVGVLAEYNLGAAGGEGSARNLWRWYGRLPPADGCTG